MAGQATFDRLHPEDKRDLKRFMTGQIQNVLANQYGIGGTKVLKGQVDAAIKEEVRRQIALLTDGDQFVEKMVNALLRVYRNETGKGKEMVVKALEKGIKAAVADLATEAVKHVKININLGDSHATELHSNPNFGKFS